MDDVTVKRLEELDSYRGEGQFLYAGKSLGVTAWGMNILNLPANWADYPEHDHAADDHEEVYVVLRGHAILVVDGKSWRLEPHMVVRVGPGRKRKIVPGSDGVTILALGGSPGKPYAPSWGRRA